MMMVIIIIIIRIINIMKQEYLKHKWIVNADYVNSLTGQ
jgi:general stress protein CsbA